MARPKKLSSNTTKNWTKEELLEKKKAEETLEKLDKIDIKPPTFLDSTAKKEFKRIMPYLKQLPISNLDLAQIVSYCSFYSDLVNSIKEIKAKGLYDEDGNINDAFKVKEKASIRIQQIANTIGMTVDSRLRIIPPGDDEEDDPYAKFESD